MAPSRPLAFGALFALAAALLLAALPAAAAELGRASVRSRLGQPLQVDIELTGVRPGEEKGLAARLAPAQAYRDAGMRFDRDVASLRVVVARRAGRPILRLRSTRPLNEASLDVLVQLRSSGKWQTAWYPLRLTAAPPQALAGSKETAPAKRKPSARQAAPVAPPTVSPGPAVEAPVSRDELFGVPARETPPAGETGEPLSRDALFGLPRSSGAAAPENKGLEWRGFVQNTTAYDYQEPRHWSRAVLRTQLGTQGGSGDFKWKAAVRLDVDPVYFNSGFYPEPVRRDQRADFFLRETYVDTSLGDLQLRLGKQHIVWGEMVGLFFADVVSARDERDFILPDFQVIRIPQWAARVEHFGENSHYELIWLPYPEVNDVGKPGSEFYPFRVPPPAGFAQDFSNPAEPAHQLKNSNFGLRASTLQYGWDLSAFYYRSTDVNPTFYRELAPGPTPTLVFTPRHDRIWQVGGTLAKDFRSFVAKAEVIYASGRSFNVTRLSEPDGVVPQKTLDYVLGLDFTFGRETRLNLQYFDRVFFDYDPDLIFDRREGGISALLGGRLGDSFYPEVLVIQSVNRNDRLARWKLGWTPATNWRLTLGVDVFTGPVTGFFGRFNDRDRVYGEARYDF